MENDQQEPLSRVEVECSSQRQDPRGLPNELASAPDEPSVMGAGCGLSPMPLRSEAEAAWRRAYVDRMVERGIDRKDAQACSDAGDVDLSVNPADAVDDELSYWDADDDVP